VGRARYPHSLATSTRRKPLPVHDGGGFCTSALFLVGKRGSLCLKIGNQVLKAIKRPLVGHLTGQPFKMAKFLIDLVTVFAH
jgi:hypothetical protein